MSEQVFRVSPRITIFPVIHGSGDFAVEVRRRLLSGPCDCLAVPLPPSFQEQVEAAVLQLPEIRVVLQRESVRPISSDWTPDANNDEDEDDDDPLAASYVPIDPCQSVIAAIRLALEERIPRHFIDLETAVFESYSADLPDPYALKQVSAEQFAAATLPAIPTLPDGQPAARVAEMARRLVELEKTHQHIFCLCSILEWPWLRAAYATEVTRNRQPAVAMTNDADDREEVEPTEGYSVSQKTLLFMLGELPYITGCYERARADLEEDSNLSIDGVKDMLLATRIRYQAELGSLARKISPKLLRTYLQYVRNLTLVERRLTPAFYTLIVGAQQVAGDQFAVQLAEVAKTYEPASGQGDSPAGSNNQTDDDWPAADFGINRIRLPAGDVLRMKTRLPGQSITWRSCRLMPLPPKPQQSEWQMSWNPHHQCSWPPEDLAIEKFRTHLKDTALSLMGSDLARTEKFTTSLKDGLDIRETLRNWHTGEMYVKVQPPSAGTLDCVIMLFESPADPRDFPWRVTWHAENHDESTLSLFATDYRASMVGPGIGQALYGGAMFLFPPRNVSDIWRDRRFDFADTLEERLVAAACHYATSRHVAVFSPTAPGTRFRKLAKHYGKKLVHLPISKFSQETIQRLRVFHVLNGQRVRSYAADFIRKG